MGCAVSTPPTAEEEAARAAFVPLTLRTTWMGNSSSSASRLELTVTEDAKPNVRLLKLDGGFIVTSVGHVYPSETAIWSETGEHYRFICNIKPKNHDQWSWSM